MPLRWQQEARQLPLQHVQVRREPLRHRLLRHLAHHKKLL